MSTFHIFDTKLQSNYNFLQIIKNKAILGIW